MAGESAREYARRQRKKAARLERSAEAYEKGAAGEAATGAVLGRLRDSGWTVFEDVRWPGRTRANIDHVVVGPGGIFVVDSKNWSGDITVVDDVLHQEGRRRENEVAGAAEAALAVTGLVQGYAATPVLCFVRDEPVVGWARDVMLCSTANVLDVLHARPATLGPGSVARVVANLRRAFVPAMPQPRRPVQASQPVRSSQSGPPPGPYRNVRPVTVAPRKPRTPRVGRSLLGAACIFAFLMGFVFLSPYVSSHGGPQLVGQTTTKATIGDTVRLPDETARPELDVSADPAVPTTQGRPRVVLPEGYRLMAVHLRFRDAGVAPWKSPTLSFSARDASGGAVPTVRVHGLGIGPLLPDVLRLAPGGIKEGYIALAVPRDRKLVAVSVTVGDSPRDTVEWEIHQS